MNIEKFISYQIEKQFPSLFLEDGKELVDLVKYYYQFLEENTKQSVYNNRRLFEYRDIDNTLEKMVIFFKNKYMKDLPLDQNNTRFILKHILDLYRRRGTPEGIELFFRFFYDESVIIYYPAEAMLKPSSSTWKSGIFLQLYPTSIDALRDLPGKNIIGSISKAEAVVDRVLFLLINNVISPIVYLNSVRGAFRGFDDIINVENSVVRNYGKVYGSLDRIAVATDDSRATTGNQVGDILDVQFLDAKAGKVIVTETTENVSGEITYKIADGGFGYTIENTLLYVSNQIIFTNNTFQQLEILEYLKDQFGNRGKVIGGTDILVGVRMDPGDEFVPASVITTDRLSGNITIPVVSIVAKNESSPGPLYPEDPDPNILSVKLTEMDNIETVSLITDVIDDFKNVPLNSVNFNTVPPAVRPMSGTANPATLATPLNQAFNLTPFQIGSLKKFSNVRPGANYINRVFAIPYDQNLTNFDVYNQAITLEQISANFEEGQIITQGSVTGRILRIQGNTLYVLPYSYFGFEKAPIVYKGVTYNVISISRDYTSKKYGFNGVIETTTEFAVGKILSVDIINSGYGYADGGEVTLVNSAGSVRGVGIASARGQGKIEGRWSSTESHLNAQDGKVLQDSNFYQDYSYQISSETDINNYRSTLEEIAHLAGTKMFGKFLLRKEANVSSSARISIVRETT